MMAGPWPASSPDSALPLLVNYRACRAPAWHSQTLARLERTRRVRTLGALGIEITRNAPLDAPRQLTIGAAPGSTAPCRPRRGSDDRSTSEAPLQRDALSIAGPPVVCPVRFPAFCADIFFP